MRSLTCILLALMAFEGCAREQTKAPDIEEFLVGSPSPAPSHLEREYVAEVQAIQRAELRVRTRGVIEEIHVDEGQRVSSGALLFVVSAKELQHELERAQAATQSAVAERNAMEVERGSVRLMHEKNVIADSELAMAEAKLQAATAKLEEARAAERQAALNLHYSRVRAPFSGFVNRIPHKVGSMVDVTDVLTTITNTDEVYAYFHISEQEHLESDVNAAREVRLRLANGQMYPEPGRIDALANEVDARTASIAVRARFKNEAHVLRHGSAAKLIVGTPLHGALVIPQRATFEVQDHVYIYALDGNAVVHTTQIHPKARIGDDFVVDGLVGKDMTFVLEGVQLVKDGQKIVPLRQTRTAATEQ